MKAMPLPFEDLQGEGVLDFSSSSSSSTYPNSLPQNPPQNHHPQYQQKWQSHTTKLLQNRCYVGSVEPTSVLDKRRSPSPPTPSSTLSSSQSANDGGGASADTTVTGGAAALSGNPSVDLISSAERCGHQLGMEDWESVLSGSPSQEQSILKLIMGDVEDPSLGFDRLLQGGNGSQDLEFNAGFGVVDQVFGFDPMSSPNLASNIDPSHHGPLSEFPLIGTNPRMGSLLNQNHQSPNLLFPTSATNVFPVMFQQPQEAAAIEAANEKPQILNHPQMIINQNQAHFVQNPTVFLPLLHSQSQEQHMSSPPALKRLNSGPLGANYAIPRHPFSDSRPELSVQTQHHQRPPPMLKQKIVCDELGNQQLQQAITNPICQAAELIDTQNPVLAQGILARLNHQLSLPIGKPFQRVAFYFKEALQLALHRINSITTTTNSSACNLILKIGAYKCFSELSPVLQFANFTCNQALLEAFDGFDRIHIVDFDIGYGGQWASLLHELALRKGGAPSLKITAFASCDDEEIELIFTRENLKNFAGESSMRFELEIFSLESLSSGSWPMPLRSSEKEVIAVNLPVRSFVNYPTFFPLVLGFVKQLSPKIVVSLDRGCDRNDLPFAHHINHAIQTYSSLLESLDAVNMNSDTLHKIEKFLVQPSIEKLVLGRYRSLDKIPTWRSLFLQSGFSALPFSNFAESQAECLVQQIPLEGFHVEKRQSALVLCWQRKELISASAWRC